jgi:toxin-antitoxin system PIN domain toxin
MIYLADVNVWVALANAGDVHHKDALNWLDEARGEEVVFCRITQMGLLRLLTNRRVMGENVLTSARAWEVYERLWRETGARFAPEPFGLEATWRAATRHVASGPNFWTDAYLAAFAEAGGYTVVTFDRGFGRYPKAPVRILTT